ncbi:MAG: hypothetical protein KGJ57_13745 [Sphingomonadales bacterium]|nr:hypothetical protein [Sphingomonadales bacterium]MDE2170472.1 hypothetical protein [Sphingomonadales bacterium]
MTTRAAGWLLQRYIESAQPASSATVRTYTTSGDATHRLLDIIDTMQLKNVFDVSMPIRVICSTGGSLMCVLQRHHLGTSRCRWEPSNPTPHKGAIRRIVADQLIALRETAVPRQGTV